MRSLLFLLALAVLAGCDLGTNDPAVPTVSGEWESTVGGAVLRLELTEHREGVVGSADWGRDYYTIEGTHVHPRVSLILKGPFALERTLNLEGSFSDPRTIQGTLSTAGFPTQAVTLRRTGGPTR